MILIKILFKIGSVSFQAEFNGGERELMILQYDTVVERLETS